jgi:integrase
MSVFKRKDTQGYSYDFVVGGQRFSGNTRATSLREAKREEERLKEAVRLDQSQNSSKSDLTFERAALRCMREFGQQHMNVLTSVADVERLVQRIGSLTLVSHITNNLVAEVVAARREDDRAVGDGTKGQRRVSNATVNRSTTELLRKILRRAEKVWKLRVQDVAWSEHMLKEPKERVREASAAEENLLLDELGEGYRTVVRFAILAGCRLDELVSLTWPRVDFFARQFTVIGKNGTARTIPMSQVIFDLLFAEQRHHSEQVFTYVARRSDRRKALIAGQRYPMTYYGLQIAVRRAVVKKGIVGLRFHDLRHTAATRTLRKSNLRVVQHLLGHADIATTAKYAHAQTEDIRAALEAVSPTTNPTGAAKKRANALKYKD